MTRRSKTRRSLLVEMGRELDELAAVASMGDFRRYQDDSLFRSAVAFRWLRVAEPAAQLLRRRLVDEDQLESWSDIPQIRHSLAHDFDDEISYWVLWDNLAQASGTWQMDVAQLLAA